MADVSGLTDRHNILAGNVIGISHKIRSRSGG
jgi:hypothetical protein